MPGVGGFLAGRRAWASRIRTALPVALRNRWALAIRAGVGMGIPAVALTLSGHPAEAGFAAMGALAGVYLPTSPYAFRASAVGLIGLALAIGAGLGALVGGNLWLAAAVAGLYTAAVSLVAHAAELPPPRELLIVMVMLASTDIPLAAVAGPDRVLWTVVGAASAWLVTMSPWLAATLARPRPGSRRAAPAWAATPEERLVGASQAATADLLDAVGGPELPGRRHAAAVAMRAAMVAVGQSGEREGRLAHRLVAIDRVLQAGLLAAAAGAPLDPALAASVRSGQLISGWEPTATAGSDLRLLQDRVFALVTGKIPAEGSAPAWGSLSGRVIAALGRHTVIAPTAARMGIAVFVAVLAGRLLGLSHAYWIALAACAVLQGSNFSHVRGRMVSRVGGTVTGVVLAWGLFALQPSLVVVALIAACLQVFVEALVVVSYGVAVVAITVMSMLLFHLGAPSLDIGSALGARLLDTVIGALLALLLRRLLWHKQTSTRLGPAQAQVITRIADVLQLRWAQVTDLRFANARQLLHADLGSLRALTNDALVDFAEHEAAGGGVTELTDRVEDLAYVALSWPITRAPAADDAAAFLFSLDDLAQASRSGAAPTAVPELAGHPVTEAAARSLHDGLRHRLG